MAVSHVVHLVRLKPPQNGGFFFSNARCLLCRPKADMPM